MKKTENYALPQWEASDTVKRADVNAAMTAIEGALAECAHVVAGVYRGDGAASRTIDLGFKPKAVLVMDGGYSLKNGSNTNGGLAVTGRDSLAVSLSDNGFTVVQQNYYCTNSLNINYHYLAFH